MKRRGGILVEAIVALLLLSLCLLAAGRILSLMQRQSRLLTQRAAALQECHLALAAAADLAPSDFSSARLAAARLPAEVRELLPDGELKIAAEPTLTPQEGVRIRAQVRWRPAPHAEPAMVELSCWRFDAPPPAQGAAP